MGLYLIVFLVAVLCAFAADVIQWRVPDNEKHVLSLSAHVRRSVSVLRSTRVVLIICSALVYILLSGMRYDTGWDYMYSYVPSLENIRAGGESHYDPFFNLILSLFARLNDNQWFFAATSLYIVAMIYVGFYLESKYVAVPVALFFTSYNYLRSFCFVAQYVAMATVFVGFMLLFKKKYAGAFALLVLGILLHKSAEIMVLLYLFYFLSNKLLITLSILLPIAAATLQGPFRSLVVRLASNTRFDYYISGEFDVGYADGSIIIANTAVFAMFLAIVLFRLSRVIEDKKATVYFLAQSLALSFSLTQAAIPVGYRFVWFFALFQLVSIPYLLRYVCRGALLYLVCAGICVAYYIWMVKWPIAVGTSQVLPYHPFFDPSVTIE